MKRVLFCSSVIFLCCIIMPLSGCGFSAPASVSGQTQTSPSSVPTSEHIISPAPTETQQILYNPVYIYYAEYTASAERLLSAFSSGLISSCSAETMRTLMEYSQHSVYVNTARISVGRLSSDDASNFSDNIFGAAQGSGTMKYQGDGSANFSFSYENGDILSGTLSDNTLQYTVSNTIQEGNEPVLNRKLYVRIEKASDNAWDSLSVASDFTGLLCINGNTVEFAHSFDASALNGTDTDMYSINSVKKFADNWFIFDGVNITNSSSPSF